MKKETIEKLNVGSIVTDGNNKYAVVGMCDHGNKFYISVDYDRYSAHTRNMAFVVSDFMELHLFCGC